MSILELVNEARKVNRSASRSQLAWEELGQEERGAIIAALESGDVGAGKLSPILQKNGVKISKYFLEQLVAK